ncbi:hypothetical protein [Telmatospirillum sp.]|uniref:hypothetical protein n=1 Tax=Telmatospirillum sp. TaxID=2079197 RepID=UPI00284A942A|nr:hypothetical protein [Telmatospirillum sp.]MDR3438177.1 hypothetical protein [Telmatospirillum sp.]
MRSGFADWITRLCHRMQSAGGPGRRFVLVAFCAAHPINPLCCPTPCPVIDTTKVADFLQEAEQVWQSVEQCRQMADRYLTLVMTFGPNGPLATELRRIPGNATNIFKTFKVEVPGMMKTGDLSNPRAVSEILKTALLDPDSLSVNQVTSQMSRVGQRTALLAEESYNGLATGLRGFSRLPDVVADSAKQGETASQARNGRTDLAANASARQAMIDNLGGMQELLSLWAAGEASAGLVDHPASPGRLPSTTSQAQSSALALSLRAAAVQLDRVNSVRSAVHQMDETISALTALHNERHAANVMIAQYPALWNTVASENKAIQFRDADAGSVVALLSRVFSDGGKAFQAVQSQLLALDKTGWKDVATKTDAAASAAAAVVAAMQSNPGVFGMPIDTQWGTAADDSDGHLLVDDLASGFSAWLEDDKQVRFWAPLRRDAESALSGLDQRVLEINNRRGFDITGGAAADREKTILSQFDQQFQAYGSLDKQSLDVGQRGQAAASVAAFQEAALAAAADTAAKTFVTVRWPQ